MEADALMAHLDESLAKVQADPEVNAMFQFHALNWRVTLMKAEEPDMFRVRIFQGAGVTLMVDALYDADTIRQQMRKTAAADERRAVILGRLLALQTEAFLAGLEQ